MFHRKSFTDGRRSHLFGLALIAALVWMAVVADPAFAIHNRSRAFSIVDPARPVPGAPDSITCQLIDFKTDDGRQDHDFYCTNPSAGFQRMLTGPGNGVIGEPLVEANAGADPKKTKVRSPGQFTCKHKAEAGASRLPEDFACKDDGGKTFTLRDFAYVNDKDDKSPSPVEYALPCRPCVSLP